MVGEEIMSASDNTLKHTPIGALPMGRLDRVPENGLPPGEPDVVAAIRAGRDRRLAQVLDPETPAWVRDEEIDPVAGVCTFALIVRTPSGWQRLRYKYDAQNDILYQWGRRPATREEVKALSPEERFRPQQ